MKDRLIHLIDVIECSICDIKDLIEYDDLKNKDSYTSIIEYVSDVIEKYKEDLNINV